MLPSASMLNKSLPSPEREKVMSDDSGSVASMDAIAKPDAISSANESALIALETTGASLISAITIDIS